MEGTAEEGEAGDEEESAAQAAPTKFTLDITLSGLCMLVRKEKGEDKQLLVLLPPVHAGHGGMPEHRAVLGTHKRYFPSGPFEEKGRFREYVLADGDLVIDELVGGDNLDLKLTPLKVADLTEVAERQAPIPGRARVTMPIKKGSRCVDCAHDGAVWKFAGRKQLMATKLVWRIKGLENRTPEGELAIQIKFKPKGGMEGEPFVIRAVPDSDVDDKMRAALYLYHTPEDELPSHPGHPDQQAEDEVDENVHFGAYYELFEPTLRVPLPSRADEEDEEEDDEEARAGDRSAAGAGEDLKLRERAAASSGGGFHGYHGRLYTCTVSTWTDTPVAR
ncbi:MAG TPA: hypothetical protein VHG08_09810 [Longimicrobium sp.]|nr:hypothetical protein [Longimicrobium sp.]